MGRCFHGLLLDAGFEAVVVEAHVHATADPRAYGFVAEVAARAAQDAAVAGAQEWAAEQRRRAEEGRFWMAMVHCIAAATAPGAAEVAEAA